MKIFIPTKGHLPRFRAWKLFPSKLTTIVTHTKEQAKGIREVVPEDIEVIASNALPNPKFPMDGAAVNRQWIEDNLVQLGEWYVFCDDNVSHVTRLCDPFYYQDSIDCSTVSSKEWRHRFFDIHLDHDQMLIELDHLRDQCIKCNTIFGGFARAMNPYFLTDRYKARGYIVTQLAVIRKMPESKWHYWEGNMWEDWTRCVDVVARYGRLVIHNWVKPHKPWYEEGGIGSEQARRDMKRQIGDALILAYPGLVRRSKNRPDVLQFAKTSQKSVDEWRKDHGYTSKPPKLLTPIT